MQKGNRLINNIIPVLNIEDIQLFTDYSNTPERISHAAIHRSDNIIKCGKQHSDIINSSPYGTCKAGSTKGFLTSKFRFVDRIEACETAFKSGQIPEEHYDLIMKDSDGNIKENSRGLISENLWDYCGFEYDNIIGYHKK